VKRVIHLKPVRPDPVGEPILIGIAFLALVIFGAAQCL
jgi:hypothetical protein